jgi:hypothetical protein
MVRPVELQDALGKTPAVERIVQLQKTDPENEQRVVMQNTGQKTQESQRKPVAATHTDEVVLHRDRNQEKKHKNDKKGEKPAEEEDAATTDTDEEPPPPPQLDITI